MALCLSTPTCRHPTTPPMTGVSWPPCPSPSCVLRFRGIRGEIGPKKSDIAAHRPRGRHVEGKHRCYARMRAPGSGAHGGGTWGSGPGARGSAGRRHVGPGAGLQKCCAGRGLTRGKTPSPGQTGSKFTIGGKNNNSLGTVRGNSCQVVRHAGNLEVADNLPTLTHAHM